MDLHDSYMGARQAASAGVNRLEVRCCCNPNKVLGHLAHPRLQQVGDVWWFVVTDASGVFDGDKKCEPTSVASRQRRLELQVDRVTTGSGRTFEAIKNRDYPLEDLQRIPGFESVPS